MVHKPTTTQALVHVLKPGATFEADHRVLPFEAHPHAGDAAADAVVPGFHLAAGCLFAPGRLVQALPYDPHFYFHGEEQALAVRLFTHGWDIFHTPRLPGYHLYNTPDSGVPARSLADYAAFSGIDYAARTLAPRAYSVGRPAMSPAVSSSVL